MAGASGAGTSPWTVFTLLLVVGMLVTGTLNTITKKVQNQTVEAGRSTPHKFDHAWFQTATMFLGEALCLLPLMIMKFQERWKKNERERWITAFDKKSLDIEEEVVPPVCSALFIIPTCCDLLGTTLGGIGLLYVSASVWQMLRGSVIIFSGILSVIFLKRKLRLHHWLAMLILCGGLTLVGSSDLLASSLGAPSAPKPPKQTGNFSNHTSSPLMSPSSTPSASPTQSTPMSLTWLGIACILGGQLASAIQMVLEETFIKHRKYPALNVVGMEGLVGVCMMALAVLPALYFVPPYPQSPQWVASMFRDDALDALLQLSQSNILISMTVLYVCSIAFYNFFGLSVTKNLTAVHRTLIDACRTIIVWVTELIVFYVVDPKYGEGWTMPWSFIELGGFVFLILGTLIYNQVIRLPCSSYDDPPSQVSSVTTTVILSNSADVRPLLEPEEVTQ